jgi:hypothetical protein
LEPQKAFETYVSAIFQIRLFTSTVSFRTEIQMFDRQDTGANIRWSLRENNEKRVDFVGVDSVSCGNACELGVGAE